MSMAKYNAGYCLLLYKHAHFLTFECKLSQLLQPTWNCLNVKCKINQSAKCHAECMPPLVYLLAPCFATVSYPCILKRCVHCVA